jgi:hypothetical protein
VLLIRIAPPQADRAAVSGGIPGDLGVGDLDVCMRALGDVECAAVALVVQQFVPVAQHQTFESHQTGAAAQIDDAAARAAGAAERGARGRVEFGAAGSHAAHQPEVLADDVELLRGVGLIVRQTDGGGVGRVGGGGIDRRLYRREIAGATGAADVEGEIRGLRRERQEGRSERQAARKTGTHGATRR